MKYFLCFATMFAVCPTIVSGQVFGHHETVAELAKASFFELEASPRKRTPTLVEVWCGGDDALTMKLRDAVEDALKSSSAFRLSTGKKPGTLLVTIPSNVEWKQLGSRTQVLYTVEFTSPDDAKLGSSKGSCWETNLGKCATQVVKDAKTAARKIG